MGNSCISSESIYQINKVTLFNPFASPTKDVNKYFISGNDKNGFIYMFEWKMLNKLKNNENGFVIKPNSTIELTYDYSHKRINNIVYVVPLHVTISEDKQATLQPFKNKSFRVNKQ
jgi:hypothetical protein